MSDFSKFQGRLNDEDDNKRECDGKPNQAIVVVVVEEDAMVVKRI